MSKTGVMASYDFVRSYGFIRPNETGHPDIFFHRRDLRLPASDLRPGLNVKFTIGADPQGRPCALEIEVTR